MSEVFKDSTSHSVFFELVDSSTGLPKTGVVYTDVVASYARAGAARVAITPGSLASASASWSSGGFILVDDTNQAGLVRLDAPNAAFVTGAEEVVITIKATGCRSASRLFRLVNIDNQTAFATAGTPDVNLTKIGNSAQSLTDLKDFVDTGYDPLTHKLQGVVNTDELAGEATVELTDASVTAAKFAADAIAADAIAAAAVTKIQDGLALAATALSSTQWTNARAAFLDNLNIGGNVASSTEVAAIQNNTRTVIVVPNVIERPDSGTDTYLVHIYLYDTAGNMEAPDAAPTVAVTNAAGTSRAARLASTTGTLVATGHYSWTYTNTSTDTLEQLLWEFSVIEGGATRVFGRQSLIVDTTAVDFTAADRIVLNAAATAAALAAAQAAIDDLPTNGELATALAAADDAVLAAIGNVQSDTNDIQSRIPDALVDGKMDSIASLELTEQNISDLADGIAAELPQVTITPFSATVSGGEVSESGKIVAYQHARFGPYQITVVDGEGTAINLTGLDLRFIGYQVTSHGAVTKMFEVASADIARSNNTATVETDDTPTTTPFAGRWVLKDHTNDRVLSRGPLKIEAMPDVA